MKETDAIHLLRETIKYLLRTPDLNLDELEEDTIRGIDLARQRIKETDHLCPFRHLVCQEAVEAHERGELL